jgi:hypothetical protein
LKRPAYSSCPPDMLAMIGQEGKVGGSEVDEPRSLS